MEAGVGSSFAQYRATEGSNVMDVISGGANDRYLIVNQMARDLTPLFWLLDHPARPPAIG
jgi:hypothetical protein